MATYRITWTRTDASLPWQTEGDSISGNQIAAPDSGILLSNIMARYGVTKEEAVSEDDLVKVVTYTGTPEALASAKQDINDEMFFSFDDISSAGLTRTVEYID